MQTVPRTPAPRNSLAPPLEPARARARTPRHGVELEGGRFVTAVVLERGPDSGSAELGEDLERPRSMAALAEDLERPWSMAALADELATAIARTSIPGPVAVTGPVTLKRGLGRQPQRGGTAAVAMRADVAGSPGPGPEAPTHDGDSPQPTILACRPLSPACGRHRLARPDLPAERLLGPATARYRASERRGVGCAGGLGPALPIFRSYTWNKSTGSRNHWTFSVVRESGATPR